MRNRIDMRVIFIALWAGVSLLKVAMASRLPLFVDEAFYWQESRHLLWAYSDLPGLTAWLIRLGDFMFGDLRSEEHTSELQSLMRISYAVFCLQNKIRPYNPSHVISTVHYSTF